MLLSRAGWSISSVKLLHCFPMHFSTRPRKILYVVRSLEVELIRIWLYTYVYGQECCEGELQDRGESARAVGGRRLRLLRGVGGMGKTKGPAQDLSDRALPGGSVTANDTPIRGSL